MKKKAILIFGTPCRGIDAIYGPFDDEQVAQSYADQVLLTQDCEIAFLIEPE